MSGSSFMLKVSVRFVSTGVDMDTLTVAAANSGCGVTATVSSAG